MIDKILIDRSVVEQALEALNPTASGNWTSTIALNAEAAIHALRAALEQPQVEQEPIGKAHEWNNSEGFTYCIWDARVVPIGTKLYTHPQPPRQPLTPLTDDQIKAANELGRGEK